MVSNVSFFINKCIRTVKKLFWWLEWQPNTWTPPYLRARFPSATCTSHTSFGSFTFSSGAKLLILEPWQSLDAVIKFAIHRCMRCFWCRRNKLVYKFDKKLINLVYIYTPLFLAKVLWCLKITSLCCTISCTSFFIFFTEQNSLAKKNFFFLRFIESFLTIVLNNLLYNIISQK